MRLEYAQLLINRRELERASEVLSEIKGGVNPRYVAQLHESLARNYCAGKQLEPARFHFEQVTRLDPRNMGLSALRRQLEKVCK
jgi:tetratricopeptide (TPR) repeat protein